MFDDDDIAIATMISNLAAISIKNAEAYEKLQKANLALKTQLPSQDMIIGKNKDVRKIFESIKKLKDTVSTVLILGESGTGKGVLARAIHEQGNRKGYPFVTVNCSVYSQTLLESELFGHEKGAFTGADRLKKGRFELASGGTVFLDEIGEMDKSLQTKLLRILQEKEFERVGGTETLMTDTRIIAATNTNLEMAMEQNQFRKDLYYRLKVIVFKLPPLRERREDIPAFARYFLEKYRNELNKPVNKFDDVSMNALLRYDYPGNTRELENIVERAVVLAEDDVIHIDDLPDEIQHRKYRYSSQITNPEKTLTISDIEKETISKTLHQCSWNQSKASRLLGISRDQLRYRLKKYELTKLNVNEQ
jgi:transcriptional regulator with PAS, ATPase and Fis domain